MSTARKNPPQAFLYTQLQISVPFAEVPWRELNEGIREAPGFLNKTWLAGVGTRSVGGFYAFDSLDHARGFALEAFPIEARRFGVAQTSRLFDAAATQEASEAMRSVHFGAAPPERVEAYVYTEVQVGLPRFNDGPWRTLNPELLAQPGLLSKTWLYGANNGTAGGIYAFESVDEAKAFCVDYFPTEARKLGAAYTTRMFDATLTRDASRAMRSPFFAS
ncbi:MAG: YdhR family protein [Nannocystales bacterium]